VTDLHELRIPHMGSVENARVVAWRVEEGAAFAAGQPLYEVETDKTLTEVCADNPGVLARRLAQEGDELKVGDLAGWWAEAGSSAAAIADALTAAAPGAARRSPPDPEAQYSPRVRSLAREHGIALVSVRGTGPGGRVTGEDVLRAVAAREASADATSAGTVTGLPAIYGTLPCDPRPNSLRRRTIARRLAETARNVPQLTADIEVELGALLAARERIKRAQRDAGLAPVSILSLIAAAVCRLLPAHPELNATFTEEKLLCWRVVNLGIAVDAPEGLVVPVIRDAGRLSLAELNAAIAARAARARAGTLDAAELEGGTFTISNPGSLGPVLRAEAILNDPQVALLGLPGMVRAPVAVDDGNGGFRVEVRSLLRPALTFDHRALDGGHVIRFLNALKADLESGEAWAEALR